MGFVGAASALSEGLWEALRGPRIGCPQVLAGLEAWLVRVREQVCEVAFRELGSHLGSVACFFEEVGARGHRAPGRTARPRVREQPGHDLTVDPRKKNSTLGMHVGDHHLAGEAVPPA
jgi:hypothetical protein